MARKQPLPGIGLHDPLHCRQACPEFNSFHQGVGQISLPEGLFLYCPLSKRRQIFPSPPPPIVERLMARFRGAREKGAMASVEWVGFSQEYTMEGPLWRETLGRSLGPHDATELVGGMCHDNSHRQETTRLHAISCTKTGWSSLTHNRVLHQALARSLGESKV